MTIAEGPRAKPDCGFVRANDIRAARRQVQISVMLIFVIACAATALGLLTRLDRPVPMRGSAAVALSGHQVAGTLLDIRR